MVKRMSGSRSTWKNVVMASLLVAIMLASTVLGAGAQEGVSPDSEAYEPDAAELAEFSDYVVVTHEAVSVNSTDASGIEATWTARVTKIYKSLIGLQVARHRSYTQWSGSGSGTMYASPKALWQEIWTMPPTSYTGQGSAWNWYNTGYGSNAQSNQWVTFIFGVPTPWGAVGSRILSRNVLGVNGWGSSWVVR